MHPPRPLRFPILAAAVVLTAGVARLPAASAPSMTPGWVDDALATEGVSLQVNRLNAVVQLTSEQRAAVTSLFMERRNVMARVGTSFGPAVRAESEKVTTALRALLTSDQLAVYDATPMISGGGSPFPPTVDRVGYLDSGVGLSADQMKAVAAIYEAEVRDYAAIPYDQRSRPLRTTDVTEQADEAVKALLTDDQRTQLAYGDGVIDGQLPVRIVAGKAIRASRRLAARIGAVTSVKRRGGRSSAANGHFTEASFKYEVTGSIGSILLSIRLTGDSLGRPSITAVTDESGAAVSL